MFKKGWQRLNQFGWVLVLAAALLLVMAILILPQASRKAQQGIQRPLEVGLPYRLTFRLEDLSNKSCLLEMNQQEIATKDCASRRVRQASVELLDEKGRPFAIVEPIPNKGLVLVTPYPGVGILPVVGRPTPSP